VKLNERNIAVLLTEDGREVLKLAAVSVENVPATLMYVQDADDMGLWARITREDGDHLVLVRWEYVLSMDFPAGETKTVGMKG
jgi:hypothetical protein